MNINGTHLIYPKTQVLASQFEPDYIPLNHPVSIAPEFFEKTSSQNHTKTSLQFCEKKYKKDYLTQFYLGSLGVIGLFVLYRALIKKPL